MSYTQAVTSLIVCVYTLTVLPHNVSAQDAGTLPAENDETISAESQPASAEEAAWENLIYLPYKNLKTVFENHAATVFLPFGEYLRLWKRSAPEGEPSDKPPVSAVITSAHYAVRVDQDLAHIDATLHINALGKPWVEVPLQFGRAAIGKVTGSNEKTLFRGTGEGTYALLIPEIGEHTIHIQLTSRVHTSPEGRRFDFNCPPVGITTMELSIPTADQTIGISPHLVSLPATSDEQETRIRATLGSTKSISVNWHPRAGLKPEMDLLAGVTNFMLVTIDEGLVHTDASLKYDVLRGRLEQVRIAVPVQERILDVNSPDARIRGWKTDHTEKRQLLTVSFLGGIEKAVVLNVHSERPIAEETFEVAGSDDDGNVFGIHSLETVRESGHLVVTYRSDLSLAVERQQGLTRVVDTDVPEPLRRANALNFRFYNSRFRLRTTVNPVQPRVVVDHHSLLVFSEEDIRLTATLSHQIEKAGLFELRFQAPDNFSVDRVEGETIQEYRFDEANRVLTVSLVEKRLGQVDLTVTGHRDFNVEAAEAEQILPLLEPLGVDRETGHVAVYAPPALDVITDQESIVAAQPEAAGPRHPSFSQIDLSQKRLVSAWSFHRRPVKLPVKTVRRPTRLSADVGTTINVKPQLIEISTIVEYSVEYAGIDTFRFSVPAEVADRVQVRSVTASPAIKQSSRAEQAVDDWVTWTIVTQRDVVGKHRFQITYDLKPETDAPAAEAEEDADQGEPRVSPPKTVMIALPRILPLSIDEGNAQDVPLARVAGEIAVTKEQTLSIAASEVPENLEPVDIRELNILPQQGTLAFRYFEQPVSLGLTSTRHAIHEVVKTVISRALVETVVGHDDRAAYRCRYRLQSSERQRLPLALPENAEPLSVQVDGKPVSLEKGQMEAGESPADWQTYVVNVARSKRSDESFLLTIQFLLPLNPQPFEDPLRPLQLPLPRVAHLSSDADTEEWSAVVQQLRMVVWIPEEYALLWSPEDFVTQNRAGTVAHLFGQLVQPTNPTDLNTWIGDDGESLYEFPIQGHAYQYSNLGGADEVQTTFAQMSFLIWLTSGALLLIGWFQRKTSWEHKLLLLMLLAFVTGMVALREADLALHGLAAARYGLVALLAVWLIHALLGTQSRAISRNSAGLPKMVRAPAVIPPPGIFQSDSTETNE